MNWFKNNPGRILFVAWIGFCVLTLWGVGQVKGVPIEIKEFKFPDLTQCACGGDFFWCLNQDDVIKLNIYYAQRPTQYIPVNCEECE